MSKNPYAPTFGVEAPGPSPTWDFAGQRLVNIPDAVPPPAPPPPDDGGGSDGRGGSDVDAEAQQESEKIVKLMKMLDDAKAKRHFNYVVSTDREKSYADTYDAFRRGELPPEAAIWAGSDAPAPRGPPPASWDEIQDEDFKEATYEDFAQEALRNGFTMEDLVRLGFAEEAGIPAPVPVRHKEGP